MSTSDARNHIGEVVHLNISFGVFLFSFPEFLLFFISSDRVSDGIFTSTLAKFSKISTREVLAHSG